MLGAKGYNPNLPPFPSPAKTAPKPPRSPLFVPAKMPNPPPAPVPQSQHRSPPLRRAGGHGHVVDRREPRSLGVPPRHPQGRRAPPPLRRQLRFFCPRHRKLPGLRTLFPEFLSFFRRGRASDLCVFCRARSARPSSAWRSPRPSESGFAGQLFDGLPVQGTL
jgi:hypothetical protein